MTAPLYLARFYQSLSFRNCLSSSPRRYTDFTMLYCPPNVTLSEVWTQHGISHCFMDTVGPAVYGGFLLLFGSIQLLMYRKYATRITDPTQISKSRLFAMQLFLLLLLPVLALLRFLMNARIYPDSAVYGYMVSMKMIKKKQLLIEIFSADLLHLRCVLLLPVQHLFDTQGALLPAALNAHPRTWTCFIAILDVGFH